MSAIIIASKNQQMPIQIYSNSAKIVSRRKSIYLLKVMNLNCV